MVSLTTTQVETLFGELEYIGPQLKVLGLVEICGGIVCPADEDVFEEFSPATAGADYLCQQNL
jgi:hypothetical protein